MGYRDLGLRRARVAYPGCASRLPQISGSRHHQHLPLDHHRSIHLAIGPGGVFVIDSKQWTGSIHQSADGLAWHNHSPLERTLETVRWEAAAVGRLLGRPSAGRPHGRASPPRPTAGPGWS